MQSVQVAVLSRQQRHGIGLLFLRSKQLHLLYLAQKQALSVTDMHVPYKAVIDD